MASPSVGSVVLVRFPFSNLEGAKLRPAVVLADVARGDFVLCQVTSNPYADKQAIEIQDADFREGGLQRVSYARPGKLFTANEDLISNVVGILAPRNHGNIVDAVVRLLRTGE